jgi:hypothetical protein
MSASKSNFSRSKMYNALLKATGYTGPATVYMSLHTAAPGLTGANEITGNAYARQPITFGADTNGAGVSSNAPQFPAPTPSNWGTATHFALWDAVSAGNCIGADALANPVATSVGVPVLFPIGSVTWTET